MRYSQEGTGKVCPSFASPTSSFHLYPSHLGSVATLLVTDIHQGPLAGLPWWQVSTSCWLAKALWLIFSEGVQLAKLLP